MQPLQRNHSPSASDDADNAANIHSHKTPPRPRIISTPPRAPTPPNQCCSATHPATSHQPTNSIATNLDPSLRTPPLIKPTPIPFFRPIRPARPNICRHAAHASEHTQAPIPLHPGRSKTLTNALDHHTAIPRNEAPSITSTPPFQRADQICVPSRPGTHQIRWSHATLTIRRQRGGRQRTTPTTNHGGDEPRRRQTTAATNDGGANPIPQNVQIVGMKNVRVESTICEHDGQTPSSAIRLKSFIRKQTSSCFEKMFQRRWGSHVTSRCMVTGCDGRGDVTTTYGFWR